MARAPHPYFTCPISWHTKLADAMADAREHDRLVMILHSRVQCGGSRALVEKSLRKDELSEVIERDFVPLASDADHPEPDVLALIAGLPAKEPTPLCIYVSTDGRVVQSSAGGRHPAVLLNDLQQAWTKRHG